MRFYNHILSFLLAAVLLFTACSRDADAPDSSSSFQFTLGTLTRATDVAFEEGDEIGLYAVKRSGNTVGTMLANGNFCDNKKYIYRSGNFQPATTSDIIYSPSGEKVDFYAYYPYDSNVNPLSLVLSSSADQSVGSNYKSSDYLLAKAEGGYVNGKTPVSLTFSHLMGLIEVVISRSGSDAITSAKIAEAMTDQTGHLQRGTMSITNNAKKQVAMLSKDATASQYIFRALLPAGNIFSPGKDAFVFTLANGSTKKFVSNAELSVQSGKTTRFNLNLPADVITYQYSLTVTPNLLSFASSGEVKGFTVTSKRTKIVNGVSTGITEDVAYTGAISGANASAFSVSGTSVVAQENPTTSVRNGVLTITQVEAGGKYATVILEQAGSAVTTYEYSLTVTPNYLSFDKGGGTKSFTVTSKRTKFLNGISTGITENVDCTSIISGANASAFSVYGTSVTAQGNSTTGVRSGRLTITQRETGGKSATITLEQAGNEVITYQYSLTVTPNFLSFASKGETKSFTVTSKRTKIVNGVSTGITEDAPYTSAISGTNASAFSVSGTSVVAKDNPTTDFRDGILTITQVGTGGKTATITLEQEGKIDIGTEI